jgi:AraC-like DNA-binding protein
MVLAPAEWIGVGRLFDKADMEPRAIEAWRLALSGELGELEVDCAERTWSDLGWRYKRREAWDAAFDVWDTWIRCIPMAIEPLVEQAKYYEWTDRDLDKALDCTERALRRALAGPTGMNRYKTLAELRHRQERLQRKLEREQEGERD